MNIAFLGYVDFLIIFTAAVGLLLVLFLMRRHWTRPPSRLRRILEEGEERVSPAEVDYLAPLLLYEEQYPAFVETLGLVLSKFPVEKFLGGSPFEPPLRFLSEAVYQQADSNSIEAAMSHILRLFLEDPDIEYHCRPDLSRLVKSFLAEVESGVEPGLQRV